MMEIRALDELDQKLRLLLENLQTVKAENQRLLQMKHQSSPGVRDAIIKIQSSLIKISGWIDDELKEQAVLKNEHSE
jgi:hypothetical protein